MSFAELSSGVHRDCEGWPKILRSRQLARERGVDWIWIDTCCVDKSSITEVSEDINSMYKYYARGKECYAYLYDVAWKPKDSGDRFMTVDGDGTLQPSDWFSRGWTLEELLAPGTPCKSNDGPARVVASSMYFFDKDWKEVDKKSDPDSYAEISRHTLIRQEHLSSSGSHAGASIAMRMSWAARRSTEEPEDRMYSLIGVFGINMSLMYGEGEAKAFMRLQSELMAHSEDQSILAWINPTRHGEPLPCGMVATSLDWFKDSSDVVSFSIKDKEKPLYDMTKEGLAWRVCNGGRMMINVEGRSHNSKETIMLACTKSSGGRNVERRNVVRIDPQRVGDSMRRVSSGRWITSSKFNVPTNNRFLNPGLRRVFYIKQD